MPRPIVCPNTQLFGIGFGQNGSTSNFGTITLPLVCAIASCSIMCWPMARAASRTISPAPIKRVRLRLIPSFLPRTECCGMCAARAICGGQYTLSRHAVFTHFPRLRGLLLAAMMLVSLSLIVAGHEIPADVTIQTLLKPEGHRLRVLVRVPLVAMRDFNYPTRGDRAAGILDVSRADLLLRDAAMLWVAGYVEIYEGDTLLLPPTVVDLRVSLPSDKSFGSYEEALAHVTGPRLPDDIDLQWSEGLLDILFEYRIQSDAARFSVQPGFDRLGLRTYTTLRLITSAGTVRAFEFTGNPGLVRLDPDWSQVVRRFVASGVQQIIEPTDLVLFLVCLVLPFRRLRPLAVVAAAFALGYSVTLLASSYGLAPDALWFAPLVST